MISKDRLNELALGIIDAHGLDISMQSAEIFAHALIKAVEKEAEVVGYQATRNGFICKENKNPEYNKPLIALPLVEGD